MYILYSIDHTIATEIYNYIILSLKKNQVLDYYVHVMGHQAKFSFYMNIKTKKFVLGQTT